MSIRWMDGFDRYGTSGDQSTAILRKWTSTHSTSSYGIGMPVSSGRYGGYAVCLGYDGSFGFSRLETNVTTINGTTKLVVGFNVYVTANSQMVISYPRDTSLTYSVLGIKIQSGLIFLGQQLTNNTYYGTDSSLVTRLASQSVTNNTWNHVEVVSTYASVTTPTTTASNSLYVNGQLVGTPTNFNLRTSFSANPYPLMIVSGSNTTGHTLIDDFYVIDDIAARSEPVDRLGYTARICTLYPSAAKNGVDVWTPNNAVDATTAVKQVPIGAAYITAPSSNSVQEFEFDNLPNNVSDVKGLQLNTLASGDTGATYKHMVNGTSVLDTTLITTLTSRTTQLTVVDTAAVNAIQAGVSS